MADRPPRSGLLHDVSRSVFWNTALLPLVTTAGLLLSILVRRSFGLESGFYDVALGIANSILFYSGLGLAGSLPKFLPEVQAIAGRTATRRLVVRLGSIRLAVVIAIVIPLNIWAESLAQAMNLGPDGSAYLRLLTAILIGRAVLDFAYRALDSFFRQLTVNILSLAHGVLDLVLVALVVLMGLQISGVIAAFGVSAIVLACVASMALFRCLQALPSIPAAVHEPEPPASRIWTLSGITYLRDLSLYFATPAFASPVLLKMLGSPEPVALFATSFFVASSTVTLVVSGFRGIYRPAFVHVMAAGDRAELHRAFDLINKVQILAVVPAGVGLAVMVGDYLPLLYGEPFIAAVPVARALVLLLFAETAIAVGGLVMWVGERYRPLLTGQLIMVAGAPLFIWTAGRSGLLAAALVLGGSRLAASIYGYTAARSAYGVRYPWRFAGKVTLVSTVMAAVLGAIRQVWPTSIIEAATLTALGVAVFIIGVRLFHVLGSGEIDVLERSSIPGKHLLARWLRGGSQNPIRDSAR